jgi:hypothetical protein
MSEGFMNPMLDNEEEPASARDLLAGIGGILPVEPIIGAPRAKRPPAPIAVTTVGAEEAELFERVIAEGLPVAPPLPEERRVLATFIRLSIYFALALAVVLPLLFGSRWFDTNDVKVSAETKDFYDAIEAIPSGSLVLIAFDYDPNTAAEMNLQAKAISHHLMRRGLKVAAISMFAPGPAIAQKILEESAVFYDFRYGEDYVNLGYLPYQPATLQAFVSNPAGGEDYREREPVSSFPIASNLKSIEDIAIVVELAGGPETLRWWVEQVGARYGTKMVAGITASIDPYVRPYYQGRQLSGLLVGIPGAADYEALNRLPGEAMEDLDSQSMAHLVVITIIIIGNLGYLINQWLRRR